MASAPERRAERGDAARRDGPADARRRAGAHPGARGEHQLPRCAALPRPVPGAAPAAVHARRRDLRQDRGRPTGARHPALPNGGFAQYVVADGTALLPAPDALDDAEAAALHIGYQTGWFGLHRRAHLQAGETLLVHAAAGGVGSAAVQLGKAAGATVIGVVGGPEKAKTAAELGCDLVIDRRTEDIVAAVKEFTGGRGADVVYDPVGGDAYAKSVKCIAFEGRVIVVGFASGVIPTPGLNHALVKNYSVVGLHWGLYNTKDPQAVRDCHEELTRLAAQGVIKPLISERVPMDGAAAAVQRVADGTSTGRIVVLPSGAAR